MTFQFGVVLWEMWIFIGKEAGCPAVSSKRKPWKIWFIIKFSFIFSLFINSYIFTNWILLFELPNNLEWYFSPQRNENHFIFNSVIKSNVHGKDLLLQRLSRSGLSRFPCTSQSGHPLPWSQCHQHRGHEAQQHRAPLGTRQTGRAPQSSACCAHIDSESVGLGGPEVLTADRLPGGANTASSEDWTRLRTRGPEGGIIIFISAGLSLAMRTLHPLCLVAQNSPSWEIKRASWVHACERITFNYFDFFPTHHHAGNGPLRCDSCCGWKADEKNNITGRVLSIT